jgi:hypothetical protein
LLRTNRACVFSSPLAYDANSPCLDLLNCSDAGHSGLQRHNATVVMRVPAKFANPVTCFMHAQTYLAETSIGQTLSDDDQVKIVCARAHTVDASIPALSPD